MARLVYAALAVSAALCISTGCHKNVILPHSAPQSTPLSGPRPAGTVPVLYSGPGYPPAATGVVGDFYVDVPDNTLFGPKSILGWGEGHVLQNVGGHTTVYSGVGVPDPSLGLLGNFYLDLLNNNLYGPKTLSGWGTSFSLTGASSADTVSVK